MMKSEEGKNLLMQARQANGAIRHLKAINEGDEKRGVFIRGKHLFTQGRIRAACRRGGGG
jgi:hypothetical protein